MQIDNKYSIDSLDLAIDKNKVKCLPERLGTGIKGILLDTDEILCYDDIEYHNIAQINTTRLKNQRVTSLTYTDDNHTTELLYKTKNEPKANGKFQKGQRVDKLIMQVTAKVLKQDYLNGINGKNINNVYEYINSAGIIMDFDTFMNGIQTRDTDIKKDIILDEDSFNNFSEFLRLKTKLSEKSNIGYNQFGFKNGKKTKEYENNTGIQFGIRDKYHLFAKGYDKAKQLNSTEQKPFKDLYLSNYDLTDLKRIETNIPARFFKNYGIGNRLIDLINVVDKEQNKLKYIVTDILKQHIDFDKPIPTADKKLLISNHNIDLYNTISLCVKAKFSLSMTIDFIIDSYTNYTTFHRNTISTRKKDIRYLYNSITKTSAIKNDMNLNSQIIKHNKKQILDFSNINNSLNKFGIDLNVIN